jgi:S-DNA-T family DNA segregation ATPase FtsK/SpoIIIE
MSDRRLRLDLAAFVLLAMGLLVALCILGHEGPANGLVHPRPEPRNLLGVPGAWLAQSLYEALGVAVYLLLASWFLLVILLFLRRTWLRWAVRLLGTLILLPTATVLTDLVANYWPSLPLPQRGGTLGAWLSLVLRESLAPLTRFLVIGGVLFLGLVLTLDFAMAHSCRLTWRALRWHLAGLRRCVRWWRRRTPPSYPDSAEALAVARAEAVAATRAEEQAVVPTPAAATTDGTIPIHHHDHTVLPSDPEIDLRAGAPAPAQSDADRFANYQLPALTLLEDPAPFPHDRHDQHLRDTAALLEKTFKDFSLSVRVVGINTGPVITQYEVALETGLRVNKVTGLGDDLALNLRVPSVRIVAPIPGKNTVGIEVPNEHRATVRLKEVLLAGAKRAAKMRVPLYLGKDTEGRPLVYDLAEMPHLLIAGRTGTGKSVCLNSIILSILTTRRPDEVKMIMIDPKRVELSDYARLPHLMHPIVTDMKKAEVILSWAVDKMEERYDLLARVRVRNIAGYNELTPEERFRRLGEMTEEERAHVPEHMPYIVIFVDELSDLLMQMKKEVEGHIIRLAQKSRAAGIHLVLATQKPTVDVITGLIKSNLPARICFQVSSRSDSRVVLDEMGADKLLGKGDMLFLQPGTSTLVRAQGTYLDDKEIEKVVGTLEGEPCYAEELIRLKADGSDGEGGGLGALHTRDDELYEAAIDVVVREGRGSVSLLQRVLGIGYGRAARLIDYMAEDGIVGSYNGSNAREVLFTPAQWDELKAGQR